MESRPQNTDSSFPENFLPWNTKRVDYTVISEFSQGFLLYSGKPLHRGSYINAYV